jgi:hypothetical protein
MTLALTTNTDLDLSMFGQCVIHFTQMKDDQETVDVTEAIIHAQYQSGDLNQHPIISVYNSSFDEKESVDFLIQPDISVKEECNLNVLLGFNRDQNRTINRILMGSNYTYSSHPFSTYIFVMDREHKYFINQQWRKLPSRMFYFEYPNSTQFSLNDPPCLWYLCFFCDQLWYMMYMTPDLASASYLNLRSNWLKLDIEFDAPYSSLRFKLEQAEFLAFKKTTIENCHCGFIALLSKTTESNMTVIVKPQRWKETYYIGYTGYILTQIVHRDVSFRVATISWYREQVFENIYYCICKLKTKRAFVAEG